MRALQRVSDKVCSNQDEKNVYNKLGSLIMDEDDERKIISLFEALSGERPLQTLPSDVMSSLPAIASSFDTSAWKSASSWVKWWTKPSHLSE